MRPGSEYLADEPTGAPAPCAAEFYGARPAAILGASLVAALGLMTLLRWTASPSAISEKVVQQPIPQDAAAASARAELTAPDPGDNPP